MCGCIQLRGIIAILEPLFAGGRHEFGMTLTISR
jgi:hypothetical protein